MKLSYLADILAIPMWVWLLSYFLRQEDKTVEGWLLTAFAAVGLLADSVFVICGL